MTGPGPDVHPSAEDPVVRALSDGVGGPVGEHAGQAGRGRGFWTPVRVILAMTAICFAVGLVQKSQCFTADEQGPNFRYSHMCYSDLPPLYTLRGLAEHEWPYSEDPEVRARYEVMEYPVGISYWAWGSAWVTHWLSGSPDLGPRYATPADELSARDDVGREVELFTVVNAVGFGGLALLAAWFLTKVNRRRPWDAAIFALSPTLALTGIINWDLLAVALVAGALWAWSEDRPVLTGVLIGLGTAAKLYPLFLLGALLIICLRRRRYVDFVLVAVWGVAAWALVNAPAFLSGKEQWKVFWSFNSERAADLGSLWQLAAQAGDTAFAPETINTWSWVLFGLWCAGVFALGMLAPDTPRFAQLGLLIVVGFLIVNKVYSPQYVLWLLPLAALARPRWRDQIVWQSGEVLYFAAIWWYLGGFLAPSGGGDAGFYWLAIVVRVACELYLVAIVVRDILAPEHDPVREVAQVTARSGTHDRARWQSITP